MKTSKILSQFRNRGIYVSLLIVSVLLMKISVYYIPFLVFINIYIYKKHRDLLIYALVILAIIFIHGLYILSPGKLEGEFLVISQVEEREYNTKFTVRKGVKKYIVYSDKHSKIKSGDILTINGEMQKPNQSTIPNTFDYKNYLLSSNISNTIFAENVTIKDNVFVLVKIKNVVRKYIETHHPCTSDYIKTFILADKSDFDEKLMVDINQLGVSHLFAVSGLHIGLLVISLKKLIERVNIKIDPSFVILPILMLYVIVTSFSPSIVRASLMYLFLHLNKKLNLELSTLDILSLAFIVLTMIKPFSIYNVGFNLSFLITLTILLSSFHLKGKNTVKQLLIISILAMMISLPITTSISYQINMISVLANVILVWFMTVVVLPIGYVTFLVYPIDHIYEYVVYFYNSIIRYFADIDLLTYDFSFVHPIQIMLYYLLVFLIISTTQKRHVVMLVIFLLFSYLIQSFNPVKLVSMIDIYGDSIFIKDQFDKCNVLVDTGTNDQYDSVISYLKGKQVRRIDYLIITHSHEDHLGEYSDILDSMDVRNVITWESNVEGMLDCGTLSLQFLRFSGDYTNPNNLSVVFLLDIDHKRYLFTGDMEEQLEMEYIDLYDFDVDILKSGHHGSNTSSTDEFLENVQAETVLISCYRYNTHGHPNDEVIDRYRRFNIEIYRTDLHGTIELYYLFNKEYKKYHKP